MENKGQIGHKCGPKVGGGGEKGPKRAQEKLPQDGEGPKSVQGKLDQRKAGRNDGKATQEDAGKESPQRGAREGEDTAGGNWGAGDDDDEDAEATPERGEEPEWGENDAWEAERQAVKLSLCIEGNGSSGRRKDR